MANKLDSMPWEDWFGGFLGSAIKAKKKRKEKLQKEREKLKAAK